MYTGATCSSLCNIADVEEESVREHFTVCGDISDVRVIRDRTTGAGKGFGYVNFVVICDTLFC